MLRRLLLVCLWAAIPCVVSAQIVRKVEIERRPVFENGDLPVGAAEILNSLHPITEEGVIRRDLLVRPGEPYDSFLVAESARILRSRKYLGDVYVEVTPVEGDSVDLRFVTRDLWTLELSLQPGGGGGAYSIDFAVSDDNFRGKAQTFEVGYNLSDRRSSGRIALIEPALILPHLQGSIAYGAHEEGNYFVAGLSHAMWAVTVPWEYGVSVQRTRDNHLFYKEDDYAFRYPFTFRQVYASLARGWGQRTRLIAGVGLLWQEQTYGARQIYAGVPAQLLAEARYFTIPDRKRVMPSGGFRLEHFTYPVGRYLDHFGRAEDFPSGAGTVMRVGRISPDLGSSVARNLYAAELRAGAVWSPVYANFQGGIEYETNDGASEGGTQLSTMARLYVKPSLRHTFALRLAHAGWYRANRLGQMFLGALSGVRGLSARYDDGTRVWYGNAEYRYFSPLHILTVGVGGVVFTDVGQVWNRGASPRLADAEWSWGAGLRFGLLRTAGDKVFRLDFAHGPDGWVTTFGTQMYFSFDLKGPMGI